MLQLEIVKEGGKKMEIYTVKEVAKKLQLSYRKILDLIKKRELEAKKVGKSYRITENQLRRYLEGDNTTEEK